MAGDFEIEMSLSKSCISTIADNIELYMKKYPPHRTKPKKPGPDRGVSGSVMTDPPRTEGCTPMDCGEPCDVPSEPLDLSTSDNPLSGGSEDAKVMQYISSLDVECHHNPPCGTKKEQDSKSTESCGASAMDIFFPNPISEDLLECVCKKGKLTDTVIEFFADSNKFRIRHMYLKKAGHLSPEGLRQLLENHSLYELNAERINEVRENSSIAPNEKKKKITVADIVSSVNQSTRERLMALNISGIPSEKEDWIPMAIYVNGGEFKKLSILTNIRTLNVSYTNFTDNDLNTVIACMKHLQFLNISQTYVRSILYLGDLNAPKLKSLTMSNMDKLNMPKESLFDVLCKLKDLEHLDISTEKRPARHYGNVVPNVNVAIGMMMVGGFPLPNLTSLDISGREGIEEVAFLNFYTNHTRLTFIGLLFTGLDNLACFTQEKNEQFRPHLKVTGDCTESQVIESLSRYHKRPYFAKEALFSLFHQTQMTPQYNREQLELVLRCMKNHRQKNDLCGSVQMAATACVYNLTSKEMVLKIPGTILSKVVDETLKTMEIFNDKHQLQKNCLLTLCSDRILKEVKFDYYKTAQLVMSCLCTSEDAAMRRMSVAVISILAAKISTDETAILGSPQYMRVLLRIVEQKIEESALDPTLKFTLSALWNLTDESPTTCQNFIDCNGLDLFAKILNMKEDNPCMQTKILGLLNNLAEVPGLRHRLLEHDCHLVHSIQHLLHSKHIEVSYFAAGIISHLAMTDIDAWHIYPTSYRSELLNDLYNSVLSWKPPEGEMVAYRTFKPFFPLLMKHETPAMQLWAAWAIRHVCMKNDKKSDKRYQEMLLEEGGIECLVMVKRNPNLDQNVLEIVDSTLQFLQRGVAF